MYKKLKKLFVIEFDQENTVSTTKTDVVISIALLLYYLMLICSFGVLVYRTYVVTYLSRFFDNRLIFDNILYLLLAMVTLFPLLVVLLARKQPLMSVGIGKKNLKKSIYYGVLFSLPFTLPFIINGLINQYTMLSFDQIVLKFTLYLVSIAFVEEVYFRGFILSRLTALVANKWLRIIVCAIIFSLFHVPFRMIQNNMTFIQYLATDPSYLLYLFRDSIIFTFIYSKTNNILAPTITHALMNLMTEIFIMP